MAFQIVRNDITKMQVDAIVNTANPRPVYGAGTDAAVYEAAGVQALLAERQKIGDIEQGQSAITAGYGLPAKYIIHTVGCAWQGGASGEEEIIRSCYRTSFALALSYELKSLAIPLLASGSYGFPKGIALRIGLSEIESFLSDHDMEITLVVFDPKSFSLSAEFYGDIEEYISDNYVEEKSEAEYSSDFTALGESSLRRRQASVGGGLPKTRRKASVVRPEKRSKASAPSPEAMEDFLAEDAGTVFCEAPIQESTEIRSIASEGSVPYDFAAARSLDDVIQNLDKTFMELVFSFADERGLTDVEVQKRANLDRKAFSKLKCGTTKNPSKSTALALAVALCLNLDDTKDLLSRAGLALSPCSKQDVIVQYFIERAAYDIYEINMALFEHGEPLLGTQAS